MRVIASVQAKRGSSRGLIHYIAHSKLDTEREPEKGRELFNAFADDLSVKRANNSLKADIVRGRPSNEELHHLVLSFRRDDYRKLGANERERRRALVVTTRAAMKQLENFLRADRLSWAAAVHRNTENPHVHVAIQKEFLSKEIESRTMTKIPREALPHFELRDGQKVLVQGFLIEAATEKIDHMIARENDLARERDAKEIHRKPTPGPESESGREKGTDSIRASTAERDILRRGVLAEYELHRIESKIAVLTDNGDKMRFLVADPVSGRKMRLSLQDLAQRGAGSDLDPKGSPERQIRTILLKMLAKEEAAKEQFRKETGGTLRDANRVRATYRKNDWKLPTPALTKDELDKFQEYCIEASEIRRFSFLESVRSELESQGEIEPRSREDLRRIAAKITISSLRMQLHQKTNIAFSDTQYYRLVDIGDKHVSLAQLDREENAARNPVLSLVEKLKNTALRLSGKRPNQAIETENERLRNDIVSKLDEQHSSVKKGLQTERKKVTVLEKILAAASGEAIGEPTYSIEQIAEIDALSVRLKLSPDYERNWGKQRRLIESAGSDCPAYRNFQKANPSADFSEHKISIIGGRALAMETVAKVELEKAKEDLKTFTESKRFQTFAIPNRNTGTVEFVSLHDVDLPKRGSLLDRAVDELFQSREHRALRRTVTSLVKDREQRLKDDVGGAKEIMAWANRNATEFKQFSLFGLKSEATYQPIFTSSEITLLETRAAGARSPKEGAWFRILLESTGDQPPRSLKEILRDFENPPMIYAAHQERDTTTQKTPDQIGVVVSEHPAQLQDREEKRKEPKFHGNSR